MDDFTKKGSETAKNGFKNEHSVAAKFNSWKTDKEAQEWLKIMDYDLNKIEFVKAVVLHGYKTDVNVQVQIELKEAINTENIQVKLVSNKSGFNQVDKRWLKSYSELWNMPNNVFTILQYFTGELSPYKENTRDSRRMFFNEMTKEEQQIIINWFNENKTLILSDIIKGRGQFSAEWILVIQCIDTNYRWVLKNINEALQHYSSSNVKFSPQGSLNIGFVGMQRKGGDRGRNTAKMLQFKLDPIKLFNL